MAIELLFRTSGSQNRFRDILVNTIGSKYGTHALICSGFFQENFRGNSYQATSEANFKFKASAANSKKQIITVGIHNSTWRPSYKEFVKNMRAANVDLYPKITSSFHWHAKVYILLNERAPILGVIGSSNITRNAFSVSAPFNYECDTLIWNARIRGLTDIVREVVPLKNDGYDAMKLKYSRKDNGDKSEIDYLSDLHRRILNDGKIKDLEE